jgi:hypothetical protein
MFLKLAVPFIDISNIDCLTAYTACLVGFIRTVNGRSKKEAVEDRY